MLTGAPTTLKCHRGPIGTKRSRAGPGSAFMYRSGVRGGPGGKAENEPQHVAHRRKFHACHIDHAFSAASAPPLPRIRVGKRWSGHHVPPPSRTTTVDAASASKAHVWHRTTSDDRAVDLMDSTDRHRERIDPYSLPQNAPWLFGRQPSGSFQVAERRCGAEGSQCKSVLALPPPVAAQLTGHHGRW